MRVSTLFVQNRACFARRLLNGDECSVHICAGSAAFTAMALSSAGRNRQKWSYSILHQDQFGIHLSVVSASFSVLQLAPATCSVRSCLGRPFSLTARTSVAHVRA